MTLLKQVCPHEGRALIAVITELALEDVCDIVVVLDVLVNDVGAVVLLLLVMTMEDWVVELLLEVVEELSLETVVKVLQLPHKG
jgi:hypothetical protein